MERIGIYGGTFNPPHAGHIQAAKQAVTALNLDKLVIVPTSIAPHKAIPEHSPTPRQSASKCCALRRRTARRPRFRTSS